MVPHGAHHSTSTAYSARKKGTLQPEINNQAMENHSYWSVMMENGNVSPHALKKKNRFVHDGCRLFMLPGEFDNFLKFLSNINGFMDLCYLESSTTFLKFIDAFALLLNILAPKSQHHT